LNYGTQGYLVPLVYLVRLVYRVIYTIDKAEKTILIQKSVQEKILISRKNSYEF